jgi:acyl carrier protein
MISPELKQTILAVLRLDDWDIQDGTSADQVPGWDSLSHVNVIIAVEDRFGVRFNSREVLSLKKIGDLQSLVDTKLQNRKQG